MLNPRNQSPKSRNKKSNPQKPKTRKSKEIETQGWNVSFRGKESKKKANLVDIFSYFAISIFSSSNAYMLSYTRRVTRRDVTTVAPLVTVTSEVLSDNDTYQVEIDAFTSA